MAPNARPFSARWLRQSLSDRIHIVGIGNIGNFIAHSLRSTINPPPITLIMHTALEKQRWDNSTKEITVSNEGASASQSGYDVEVAELEKAFNGIGNVNLDLENNLNHDHRRIDNLIVCVNAPHVRTALFRLRHRIHRRSTILILSNGMGIIEDVNNLVFPDEDSRPDYLVGVLTHGIISKSFNSVTMGAIGSISISLIPRVRMQSPESRWRLSANSKYLLRQITRAPILQAVGLHPTKLLLIQAEKLVIDAVINTLTTLLDAPTGALLSNTWVHRVASLLIQEMSLVIRSLPELQNVPNLDLRFSPGRLEKLVFANARKTADNISLMFKHVQNGQQSEIEYLNGYILRKGGELGIACPHNYMIVQLIKGKLRMMKHELGQSIKLEASGQVG